MTALAQARDESGKTQSQPSSALQSASVSRRPRHARSSAPAIPATGNMAPPAHTCPRTLSIKVGMERILVQVSMVQIEIQRGADFLIEERDVERVSGAKYDRVDYFAAAVVKQHMIATDISNPRTNGDAALSYEGQKVLTDETPATKTLECGRGAPYCSGLPLVRTTNAFRASAAASAGNIVWAWAAKRLRPIWSCGMPASNFNKM